MLIMASMLPQKEKGKKMLEILEYLSWIGIPFTLYIECKNDQPRQGPRIPEIWDMGSTVEDGR